jgi:hypothetical protein
LLVEKEKITLFSDIWLSSPEKTLLEQPYDPRRDRPEACAFHGKSLTFCAPFGNLCYDGFSPDEGTSCQPFFGES